MVVTAGDRTGVAGLGGPRQRVIHDAADGPGAVTAVRAAAKTAIDLRRRPRAIRPWIQAVPDIDVGEHIAGADDHQPL